MKATVYVIVEVVSDYNNYTELSNGLKIATNNTIDDVEHINRIGRVIDAPEGMTVEEGDLLLFHHNICRRSWGLKGKKRQSEFYIKENTYFIPATEVFMVKRKGDDDWIALDPYVFVEALEAEHIILDNGLVMEEDSYKDKKEYMGKVAYVNKTLEREGVKNGDIIVFQEYSQHEFEIDGKLYYKMKSQDLLAVDNGEKI